MTRYRVRAVSDQHEPHHGQRQRLSPQAPVDPERPRQDQAAWLARSRAAWDARAERWDLRAEANALAADRPADLDRIWQALDLRFGARLLDAGCGSGQFAIAFAARGARVTAVDLSPAMIARARERAASRGVEIDWQESAISELSVPDASQDAILARMALPFVPDLPTALGSMRRVLKPGGRLLASVPGALSPIYESSWMRHLDGGDPGNNYLLPWELESLLEHAGWRVVDGWGEWGEDLYGTANAADSSTRDAVRAVQQATATTWTTIAE